MMIEFIKLFISLMIIGTSTAIPFSECGPLASTKIYEFPNTSITGIENVGITHDGKLLLNTITGPDTYLLDPKANKPTARLIATYPNASASLGIVEVEPNIFAVAVGDYNITTKASVYGSFAIWTLNLTNPNEPVTKLVTKMPEAEALNGMTAIKGSPGLILVADSSLGAAFSVNTTSGIYRQTIQDPLFAKLPTFPLGINGLHEIDGTLYFTNSALRLFGRVGITKKGTATGPAFKIVSSDPGLNIFDDFAVDSKGNAFITNHPHAITEVTACASQFTIANSTVYANPTSAIFANGVGGDCTLYVVTDGGLTTDPSIGGQVYSINVC